MYSTVNYYSPPPRPPPPHPHPPFCIPLPSFITVTSACVCGKEKRMYHLTVQVSTPSTGLRHPSFKEGCRKAMLGVCASLYPPPPPPPPPPGPHTPKYKCSRFSTNNNLSLSLSLSLLSLSLSLSSLSLTEFLFDVLSVAVFVIRDRFAKKPTRA